MIHILGGKFYGIIITDQQEYGVANWLYDAFEHKLSQTCQDSCVKLGYVLSKYFYAFPSNG